MRAVVAALFCLSLTSNGCLRGPLRLPDPATNPDYASHAAWACRPDKNGDACDIDLTAVEILPDGSTKILPFTANADPKVDCFYVYPTVDLRLRTGLHEDLSDNEKPFQTAGIQAARFAEVCRLYAPLYRQVTIGTYGAEKEARDFYLDAAYADVEAAFDHYISHDNGGRPFVLLSHSQGSHMVSRLIRRRIETDPNLLSRLVVALPIGGHLGTDAHGRTGGSFEHVPVCTSKEEQGCVVAYRSYPPNASNFGRDDSLKEGKLGVCVHPGNLGENGQHSLSRTYFPTGLRRFGSLPEGIAEKAPFVLYRDFYEARCVAHGDVRVLEVRPRGAAGDTRQNPIDFDSMLVNSVLGRTIRHGRSHRPRAHQGGSARTNEGAMKDAPLACPKKWLAPWSAVDAAPMFAE
jgi:hypothetical protein